MPAPDRFHTAALLYVFFAISPAVSAQDTSKIGGQSPREFIESQVPAELQRPAAGSLPESENAHPALRELIKSIPKLDPDLSYEASEVIYFAQPITDENRARIQECRDQFQPMLDQFEEVLKGSYVQFREGEKKKEQISNLLYQGPLLDARWAFEQGNQQVPPKRIRQMLKFCQILEAERDEPITIQMANALRDSTSRFAWNLGRQPATSPELLAELLTALQESHVDDGHLERMLLAEFHTFALPTLIDLAGARNVDDVLTWWRNEYRPKRPVPVEGFDAEREMKQITSQVRKILRGHNTAYDPKETVQLVINSYAVMMDVVKNNTPFSEIKPPEFIEEIEAWPEELDLTPLAAMPLMLGNEADLLDAEDVEFAREELAEIDNPLGKHLASSFDPSMSMYVSLMNACEHQARITAIAVRLFHAREGRLPENLQEVLDAKILSELPQDVMGSPISYSRESGLVWSWGVDATDNQGARRRRGNAERMLNLVRPAGAPKLPEINEDEPLYVGDYSVPIPLPPPTPK